MTSRDSASVFEHESLSDFLLAYYESKKATNKSWSYALWARMLKVRSASTLFMVAQGQRRPGLKLTRVLARYFQFNADELAHFEDLVRIARLSHVDPSAGAMFSNRVAGRARGRLLVPPTDMKEDVQIQWASVAAISQIVALKDFIEDIRWIRKRLRIEISEAEVKRVIQYCLDKKLLRREEDGRLVPSPEEVVFDSPFSKQQIRQWHQELLTLAHEALELQALDSMANRGFTLSIRRQDLPEIRKRIQEFAQEISVQFEKSSQADEVYHLQVAFFPMTGNKFVKY